MNFRKTEAKDIKRVMEIFSAARKRIAELGINQWQDGYPHEEIVLQDISLSRSYVGELDGEIVATVMLMTDNEPTYDVIYDGKWAIDGEYLTIHRDVRRDARNDPYRKPQCDNHLHRRFDGRHQSGLD